MRRATPTAGLSPQLVKHLAIATVSITALLALFATDADWGAQAQYEAVEAKNRLAATEAKKLGTKKIRMKSRQPAGSMDYDAAPDFSTGGGGGGGSYSRAPTTRQNTAKVPPPGAPMPARPSDQQAGPTQVEARNKAKPKAPTQEELDAMLEASRQRSGGTDSDD
jgi:hypothetical protein